MSRSYAETRLQCAVVSHLNLAALDGVMWFSVPNEGVRSAKAAARLKAMGMRPGAPDLALIIDGRCYGLELKAGKGRLSESQRLIEREWTAAGGVYAVAHGIDEALDLLRSWGALRHSYAFVPAKRRQLSLTLEDA